ncbi:MAG TPA: sialate O-acetylesterase [Bacteroidota bacterium]|nr:sialate O-acetylesterase [Bacteroidota bacterium]
MKSRVFFLALFLLTLTAGVRGQFKNFITVRGDRLMDGNEQLRFVSFNIPNLHYVEDNLQFSNPNPWRLPDEFEIRDALQSIKLMGGKVTRMYVLSVRKPNEEREIIRHVEAPGVFNEEAFRTLDKVLQVANETGVRIIIPFVDNWKWWGGPKEYAAFRNKPKEAFWSDPQVLADMKATIAFLVNRTNTYTGVKYKDDKAILCWETGNEMEPPTYEWTRQIASYIKSLDTNHLVAQGTNSHVLTDDAINDPNVDILSTHNYGSAAKNIPDIRKALEKINGRKPFFIGEFGFISTAEMRAMVDTVIVNGISGIMVWSLRTHNRDGGFYYHENAYRVPGFASGALWDEQAVVSLFRDRAFRINNSRLEPFPVPAPPVVLPIESPFAISWQGSVGASSYRIERRGGEGGAWSVIAEEASDADIGYRPLYIDTSAEVGKDYYYRISARSESGISAPSAVVGPVKADCAVYVDEYESDAGLYGRMGEVRYLKSNALGQAKEDKHRLAGAQGDYIVYRMPHVMKSLSLDLLYPRVTAREIQILTGETIQSLKPLNVKKNTYGSVSNEYQAYVPVRYVAEKIPVSHRFIKIVLTDQSQLCRLEVREKPGRFTVASLIADNMVLQQKMNVPVWGTGIAGATITVAGSWGKQAAGTVGADGRWLVKLPTPKAGGPYTLTIREYDTTLVVKNVLIGEVWLASGQSNMEMPLAGWPPADTIANSALEIRTSTNPLIRMFTVTHALSLDPVTSAPGVWTPASPEATGRFSATAYFFAKTLQASLHVPIGIIHSSWGGTQIEPWISADAIGKFDQYKKVLAGMNASGIERKKYSDWLNSFPAIDMTKRTGEMKWTGLDFQDAECSAPAYDDARWKEMTLPQPWEQTEMGYFDGVIWFRKTVEVPSSWLNKKISIELGPIDDMDATFINGKRVGGMETEGFWNAPRVYELPENFITQTRVPIAIRVIDNQGGGGFFGAPTQMVLRLSGTSETVSLAGAWKYLPVASYDGTTFTVFGAAGQKYYSHPALGISLTNYTPTAIYNAMIAPLVPYAIKGAIWYQGESNVGNADQYRLLLPALIADWRNKFTYSGSFPFYYVQIAPYRYGGASHSELLREAQMAALSTPNTGMAVTMDIGSVRTIHPSNKQDVGGRLAAWALAKNYGKTLPYSGPIYSSMKKEGRSLVLQFQYAGSSLVMKKNGQEDFMIAGEDRVFKPASVEVRGKTLIVSHPEISAPAAVRYAFTDTSAGVLFNAEGMPASSFRTDRWNINEPVQVTGK